MTDRARTVHLFIFGALFGFMLGNWFTPWRDESQKCWAQVHEFYNLVGEK